MSTQTHRPRIVTPTGRTSTAQLLEQIKDPIGHCQLGSKLGGSVSGCGQLHRLSDTHAGSETAIHQILVATRLVADRRPPPVPQRNVGGGVVVGGQWLVRPAN